MKEKRKIGFHVHEESTNKKESSDKKEEKKTSELQKYLEMLYDSTGELVQRDYKTSLEIAYELQDLMIVAPSTIAKTLIEMGFKTKLIEDHVCFAVYSKPDDDGLPY
jgi:hypothetical protein